MINLKIYRFSHSTPSGVGAVYLFFPPRFHLNAINVKGRHADQRLQNTAYLGIVGAWLECVRPSLRKMAL